MCLLIQFLKFHFINSFFRHVSSIINYFFFRNKVYFFFLHSLCFFCLFLLDVYKRKFQKLIMKWINILLHKNISLKKILIFRFSKLFIFFKLLRKFLNSVYLSFYSISLFVAFRHL